MAWLRMLPDAEAEAGSLVALRRCLPLLVSLMLVSPAVAGPPAARVKRPAPPDRLPDILLVVWDTVRADRLSTYGHARETTPFLSAVAEQGVLFEDATAPAPWTWPSHASLFTGEYPWVHGAHLLLSLTQESDLERFGVTRMREDLPTLAEHLARAGYRTVALSDNPWLTPSLGLVRGFEEVGNFEDDHEVLIAARDLLVERSDSPLFLFVNTMRAHAPYHRTNVPWLAQHLELFESEATPEWLRPYVTDDAVFGVDLTRSVPGEPLNGIQSYLGGTLQIPAHGFELMLDLYDGEIAFNDMFLANLIEQWFLHRGEQGIIALTSDHGEFFGEHGLIEHRGGVYEDVLRVPLVILAPGRIPPGVRVTDPVQMQDLNETLIDLAGLASLPDSLVPVIEGRKHARPVLAAALPEPSCAKIAHERVNDAWTLYRSGDEALLWSSGGAVEFYDTERDPRMLRDLAPERAARVKSLLEEAARCFEGFTPIHLRLRPRAELREP
jgi:arylsulfatase A-like enzyme